MKRTSVIIPAIFSFLLVSCSTINDVPQIIDESYCGLNNMWSIYANTPDQLVDPARGFTTYMEGSIRVFSWAQTVDEICTQKKSFASFAVRVTDKDSASLTSARARVTWILLFNHVVAVPFDVGQSGYVGEDSVNLTDGFDNNPAWCKPEVEVFFPTKGSLAADVEFLKKRISSVYAELTYRDHHK